MSIVTLSPKYQIMLPKEVREKLGLAPGQKIQVVISGDRAVLIPVRPAKETQGFLADISGDDENVEGEPNPPAAPLLG